MVGNIGTVTKASGSESLTTAQHTNDTTVCIPSPAITVPESRLFSYPSRLGNPWKPEVLEITSPEEHIERQSVELKPQYGSTTELGIQIKHSQQGLTKRHMPSLKQLAKPTYFKLYKRFRDPIVESSDVVIFDTRDRIAFHDGNIAHVISLVCPVALYLQDKGFTVKIVLRKNASKFSRELYRLLKLPFICTDRAVMGSILATEQTTIEHWDLWRVGCYGMYLNEILFEGYAADTPERLFISRRGSRKLVNEATVEAQLAKRGFTKVYFEDLSVAQQWSLCRNAKAVVAIHGAAIANLAFNPHQVKLVEILHPGYATKYYRRCQAAIGGDWCGVVGQMPENFVKELEQEGRAREFATKDINLDVSSLSRALDYLNL